MTVLFEYPAPGTVLRPLAVQTGAAEELVGEAAERIGQIIGHNSTAIETKVIESLSVAGAIVNEAHATGPVATSSWATEATEKLQTRFLAQLATGSSRCPLSGPDYPVVTTRPLAWRSSVSSPSRLSGEWALAILGQLVRVLRELRRRLPRQRPSKTFGTCWWALHLSCTTRTATIRRSVGHETPCRGLFLRSRNFGRGVGSSEGVASRRE